MSLQLLSASPRERETRAGCSATVADIRHSPKAVVSNVAPRFMNASNMQALSQMSGAIPSALNSLPAKLRLIIRDFKCVIPHDANNLGVVMV